MNGSIYIYIYKLFFYLFYTFIIKGDFTQMVKYFFHCYMYSTQAREVAPLARANNVNAIEGRKVCSLAWTLSLASTSLDHCPRHVLPPQFSRFLSLPRCLSFAKVQSCPSAHYLGRHDFLSPPVEG